MSSAKFDIQNTKTKKKNARPDVTQIIIAQNVYTRYFHSVFINLYTDKIVKLNIRIFVGNSHFLSGTSPLKL